MVFQETIHGRLVTTGDVIFTREGPNSIYSMGCTALGDKPPGEADHCLLYLGPAGLCVEAGVHGVITFEAGGNWNAEQMFMSRGLVDTFHAASSLLAGRGLGAGEEIAVRTFVRGYALGCVHKPYNLKLTDLHDEKALYCSQLVYMAYRWAGIELHAAGTVLSGRRPVQLVLPANILENSVVIRPLPTGAGNGGDASTRGACAGGHKRDVP